MTDFSKTTVHDLIPDFGSYLNDMEMNLALDEEVWNAYLADPRPVYQDLLSDFGNFPANANYEEIQAMIESAIYNYTHVY